MLNGSFGSLWMRPAEREQRSKVSEPSLSA